MLVTKEYEKCNRQYFKNLFEEILSDGADNRACDFEQHFETLNYLHANCINEQLAGDIADTLSQLNLLAQLRTEERLQKEKVVCPALKFAYKGRDDGMADVLIRLYIYDNDELMQSAMDLLEDDYVLVQAGFMTSYGIFVSAEQAFMIAKRQHQIPMTSETGALSIGDLYA